MSEFYQNIIVQKSWQLLTKLKKEMEFTLIGGWAVYLYTQRLKSKDIDIIIDYDVLDKIKSEYDVVKNNRLKKYEITKEGIDIDIYLPYFSHLGLPVEELIQYKEKKETFTVLVKELLLITKLEAYSSRRAAVKGYKDRLDIIALIILPDFDFDLYKKILKRYKLDHMKTLLLELLTETKEVKELDFNLHYFTKRKKEIIRKFT